MTTEKVTPAEAVVYRNNRMAGKLGRKACAYTAELELDLVKWMLNWAEEQGHIASNPLIKLKREAVKPVKQAALREEHLEDVVRASPNLLTVVYIVLVLDTGARRSEALMMRWEDVDWTAGTVIIRNGKGGKRRIVVTSGRSLELLRKLPRRIDSPWIFTNPGRLKPRPYSKETINDFVREAIVKSGVEKHYGGRVVRVHGLRRGHATNAVGKGVDLDSVREQLGHDNISTTQGYLDSRIDHRLAEMRQKYDRGLSTVETERKSAHRSQHGAEENATERTHHP